MKVAFCYSGQIGRVCDAAKLNKRNLFPPKYDVFIYTSEAVSQKSYPKTPSPYYKVDKSIVRPYLPGKQGWRKYANTYGIIYPLGKKRVYRELDKAFGSHIKAYKIEEDYTEKDDMSISRWQWLKENQWKKMYNCQRLLENYCEKHKENYDIVVRSRFDCAMSKRIDIVKLFKAHKGHERKIFVIGNWPNKKFMERYLVDCFMFGNPEVMKTLSEIYLRKEPYSFNPKYENYHNKYGHTSEYQVLKHLQAHKIELIYFQKRPGLYRVFR